jgi:hypothetical protein
MTQKLRRFSRRAVVKSAVAASGAVALAGSALSWLVAACSSSSGDGYGYGNYGYGLSLKERVGSRFVRRT